MQEGDLVHIPQDVYLVTKDNLNIYRTKKPMIGIFMGETPTQHCMIYVLGRKNRVEKKYVYPMEERC
jgi:hypothetical protein